MTETKHPKEFYEIDWQVEDLMRHGMISIYATADEVAEYFHKSLAAQNAYDDWRDEQAVWDDRCSDKEFADRKARRDKELADQDAAVAIWADTMRKKARV